MENKFSRHNTEVPEYMMEIMRQRRYLDECDESEDEEILAMSGLDFLNEWLEWEVYSAYLSNQTTSTVAEPETNTGTHVYIGTYKITGYDICYSCCGKIDGITASGTRATPGRTIAMKGYPYGTRVYIEGIGYRTVEDTGGFSRNAIDVLCNNHAECYAITGYRNVYLVK